MIVAGMQQVAVCPINRQLAANSVANDNVCTKNGQYNYPLGGIAVGNIHIFALCDLIRQLACSSYDSIYYDSVITNRHRRLK